MAKVPRTIAAELKPRLPIPEPHSPSQMLELCGALDDETRREYGIPAGVHTIAVGWTSVPGLRQRRFLGASKSIREAAHVPAPQPHILAPSVNAQFEDHAEQDVVNAFIDCLQENGLAHAPLDGEFLRIFISHGGGPCPKCRQGLKNRQVFPGVLAELSRRYPGLTVTLAWKSPQQQLETMFVEGGERSG